MFSHCASETKISWSNVMLPKVVPVAVAASAGPFHPGGVNVILLHFQFCVHSLETFGGILYYYMLMTMPPNTFDNLTSGIFLILPIQRLFGAMNFVVARHLGMSFGSQLNGCVPKGNFLL